MGKRGVINSMTYEIRPFRYSLRFLGVFVKFSDSRNKKPTLAVGF
jgi:hypothetical protein